jgi:hypothetical protein
MIFVSKIAGNFDLVEPNFVFWDFWCDRGDSAHILDLPGNYRKKASQFHGFPLHWHQGHLRMCPDYSSITPNLSVHLSVISTP